MSTLRQLLTSLLGRFLKFLASVRGIAPPFRLINRLFAFVASLRRWARTTPHPRKSTLHRGRQGPPESSATVNSNIICAMNVPSPGSSDVHGRGRPSPADLSYIDARSPSGHLIPPVPARRYSRDHIALMAGSLYEEPDEINQDTSRIATDSMPPSNSSITSTHHVQFVSQTSGPDIPTHPPYPPPPSSIHQTIDVPLEAPPGTSTPRSAPLPSDTDRLDPYRSRTPSSINSSRKSLSQRSCNSRNSVGRASYQEYRGPRDRPRTSAANRVAPASHTLGTAEPGGSAAFLPTIAPPSTVDPNRPGEPTNVGYEREYNYYPMSIDGVPRYEGRKTR